jgi:raffinose/stachyose/melibiose transport system substrate-binding protein
LQIPQTITELRNVCEVLKGKGITPFANQYKDSWMLGHLTGAGYGRVSDPTKFIEALNAGAAKLKDTPEMKANMDFLDLTLQYGQDKPLAADMNTACTIMGQGKAAMMAEGNWVYDTITKVDPNIQLGMFGVPATDDPAQTKLAADVNGVWHVSGSSKNKAEAAKILNWVVDSQAGKDFIAKECKFIPAYKELTSDLNSVGNDIASYVQSGKTSIWGWVDAPDGYESDSGAIMQEYIGKKIDRDQTLEKLDALWAKGIARK